MNNWFFWAIFLFAILTFYRLRRRMATPKMRVTAMLRRYHELEKSGLGEQEALLRLLATRRDWKRLPTVFLAELIARFRNKEDLMRFVSVSEDSAYQRKQYPEFAQLELEAAMAEIACIFSAFGFRLQTAGRYKEAEFVQRLALRLQPDQYFTMLPLAVTYHETGRHTDALPLFESGLENLPDQATDRIHKASAFPPSKCLAPDAELAELRQRCKKMYEACLKAVEGKPLAGICFLGVVEILC